jgi:hypothetical protein
LLKENRAHRLVGSFFFVPLQHENETVSGVMDDTLGRGAECLGAGEFTTRGDSLAGTKDVYDGEGDSHHQREKPMA